MKFYVTHRFHLIECLRNPGMPQVIERTRLVEAEDLRELSLLCASFLGKVVKQGGVIADNPIVAGREPLVLPNLTRDMTNFDLGIFIPGSMIAWIESITTIKPRQDDDDEETEMPIQ